MGLLDFIFGKDPEWVEVTEDTFSIEGTHKYSKAESKKLLKLYLDKLGFSKEDIRDEVELYTKSMQYDEESIKESDGWKPYLIKYINVYRSRTIKPKKLFFLHLLQTAGRKVGFMKKHKKTKRG